MISDIIKEIYVYFVYIVSKISSRKVNSNQIIYISSFPQYNCSWINKLNAQGFNVTILYFTDSLVNIQKYSEEGIKCIKVNNDLKFIFKYIPFIVKSKVIVIDNYLGFLARMVKACDTEIIQLWHANGAVKNFGLCSSKNQARDEKAIKRFKRVYDKTDTYVVASKQMRDVFERCCLAQNKKFLNYGYYALDSYVDIDNIKQLIQVQNKLYPELSDKKILMYMPTYRELESSFTSLDIEELSSKISDDWHIFVKYHPHMKFKDYSYLKNVTTLENSVTVSEFLPYVDCFISDYSSALFDYSLLPINKLIYIYAPDFSEYSSVVGVGDWFKEFYQNNKVEDVEDLCTKLENSISSTADIFASTWNEYNSGNANNKIFEYIMNIGD